MSNNKMLNERLKLSIALENLDSLPAIPVIARKLLALPLDTEAGEAQMIRLIEQDPQLSAKIVGLANAPMMGVGRKTNSIHDAAMLLGMKRLKSVAIGIATMTEFINQPATKNFDPQDLWLHSMTVAIAMNSLSRFIPKKIRPDENQIFLSGLLHDIGLMALHHLDAKASDELHHQLRVQPKRLMQEVELELLGITHGQIGAQLVRHWNLADEIAEVVELHHLPFAENVALVNPLVRLITIAERLLPDFGIIEHTNVVIDESEWLDLSIDPTSANDICAMVSELALQVAQLPETNEVLQPIENRSTRTTSKVVISTESNLLPAILAPMKAISQWISSVGR